MASAVLVGGPSGLGLFAQEYYSVWIKPTWSAEWQYIPWLRPVSSEDCAFPTIPTAEFTWEYGEFLTIWGDSGGYNSPLNIQNWLISIKTHTVYGEFISWVGVVQGETLDIEGYSFSTGINLGIQTIKAVGLEFFLQRRRVIGTYVLDPNSGEVVWLPRTRKFNRRASRGATLMGNFSETTYESVTTPLFGVDGLVANNLMISSYLLTFFQPTEPTFTIEGQYDALAFIEQEWEFQGETVYDALNSLIDRKRGLSAKVVTDGIGEVYIHVFSLFADPVYGAVQVPANLHQVDVFAGESPHEHATLDIISLGQYDIITVQGQEPVKACFTMSYASGTLEAGWTEDEQTAYEAASEEDRTSDRFAKVLRYFRVPNDWDWAGVEPYIDDDGYPAVTGGATWGYDKKFLRWLPWQEERVGTEEEDQGEEFREPFALIKLPKEEEDDPDEWVYADRLDEISDKTYPSMSLRMSDVAMAFWLSVTKGQQGIAKNQWLGETEPSDALFDWKDLICTINIETEEMPRVTLHVFPRGYESPNGKEALIEVPGIEVWFVAEGTVLDTEEKELVYHNSSGPYPDGVATFVRDDTEKLRAIATMAWAWYGQQRAVLRLEIKNNLNWLCVGDLVMTALSGNAWERVGTVVTRIARDYQNNTQLIETGFGELDPADFGGL